MISKYPYPPETYDNKSSNLIDIYKSNRDSEIRADLQTRRTDLVMIYQNITHDFNKACAIRSGNAFLIKESYFVGPDKFYDKRGTVGTHHFENIYHADNFKEVIDQLKDHGYMIYAVDNIMSMENTNIFDCDFPTRSAFVFGEENKGLDSEVINMCDKLIYIEQFGSVRSLNVACAATCIMCEYSRRFRTNYGEQNV